MKKVNWILLLKQKSTLTGLLGLVTAVCSAFGLAIPAEMQDQILLASVAILSAVAIGTQPEGKSAIGE